MPAVRSVLAEIHRVHRTFLRTAFRGQLQLDEDEWGEQ
jgi:hypothetical protein